MKGGGKIKEVQAIVVGVVVVGGGGGSGGDGGGSVMETRREFEEIQVKQFKTNICEKLRPRNHSSGAIY